MTREDHILAQLNELAEESRSPLAMQRAYPGIDPEIASLLPIHTQLKQLPRDIALPSTAKARLRAQLMAEFRETMVEREAGPWYRRALQRFTGALTPTSVAQALSRPAAFAAALALAITTTGISTVSAAMDSIPGDALYPVKTTLEQVRLAAATDPSTLADVNEWIAGNAVHELSKMSETGRVERASDSVARYDRHNRASKAAAEANNERLVQVYNSAPNGMKTVMEPLIVSIAPAALQSSQPTVGPTSTAITPPAAEPVGQSTTPTTTAPSAPVIEATVPEQPASNPTVNAAPPSQPLTPAKGVIADNGSQNPKGSPLDANPVQPVVPEEKTPSPIKGDTGPASAPVAASSAGSQLPQQPKNEQPAQPAPAASQPAPAPVQEAPKVEPAAPAPSQPAQPEKSDPLGSQPIGGGLSPKAQGTVAELMKETPAAGSGSLTPKVQGDTSSKGSPLGPR